MPSICKPMTSKNTNFRFIGQPIPRTEDARLLIGRGQFSDDFGFPGQTYAAMVRSPHAHARIVRVDTAAAKKMPRCSRSRISCGASRHMISIASWSPR